VTKFKWMKLRLLLTFGGVLFVSFLISGWSIFLIYKILDYESLISVINKINTQQLELRNAEKNFLLRDITNPKLFQRGEGHYLPIFKSHEIALKINLDSLQQISYIKSLNIFDELSQTKAALKEYTDTFYSLAEQFRKRGFKDWGEEGELRTAIHAIENDKVVDRALILDLRKNEKDFFLRKDLQYVEKFDHGIETLRISMSNKKGSVILKALKYIEVYQKKFHQVVEAEKTIGLSEKEGLLAQLQLAVNKLDAISVRLITIAESKIGGLVNRTILLILLAVISQFGLGIALATNFSIRQLKNHRIVSQRNEEIQAQSDELLKANQVLSKLANEIAGQKEEIQAQAEELTQNNQTISSINEKLEERIKERTSELIESKERLESAEEQASLGSVFVDVKTRTRHWSKQLFRLFGWDPQKGMPNFEEILSRIHPDDRKTVTENYQAMEQGLAPETRTFRTNPTVLPLRYLLSNWRCVKNKEGKLIRFEGTVLDITERKIAEEKLVESENRLRAIIQTEPECIKLLSANCELLEMNPAGLDMIEAENLQQVVGQSVLSLVDPKHRDAFSSLTHDVFKGKSGTLEFEMFGLKGTHRWVDTHAVPLRNASGEIVSLLGVSRDVTERKRNEESLRIAEESYRNIFENSLNGIFQTTPDGKFITANSSMASIFGYDSVEELRTIQDIGTQIYADPKERLHVKHLLNTEGKVVYEHMAVKKNKEVIWILANTQAIYDRQGKIKYFEGTVIDVTERKKAEDKLLKQFEELKKTNHELDRFVYSVSHDLRAPLASILGLINISELEDLSPRLAHYLTMIRNSVNRLEGFIKDILDYSRNSRMEVQFQEINFHELLGDIQNNFRHMNGVERMRVKIDVRKDAVFYSDLSRIKIIFNNLFSNSIKYQDIKKEISTVTVTILISQREAAMQFSDNGIGIENKHLDKVFDMFYRASENSKGSGLGLYIVKESVAKLNGSIKIKSYFGQSTTFEITIPNYLPNK